MPKLPVNRNENKELPFHDSSIDEQVIREFVRRFPMFKFVSFQRNSLNAAGPMHCIRFVGFPTDLIAVGFSAAAVDQALAEGFACDLEGPRWTLARDGRRQEGSLMAGLWVWNGERTQDHPMAWLEPRCW